MGAIVLPCGLQSRALSGRWATTWGLLGERLVRIQAGWGWRAGGP